MANFTTETDLREKLQLTDTTLVPTDLVTRSIDDAHTELLRHLDPQYDVPSPAAGLILGETLLAGVHLVQSIASAEAFAQKRLTIGGNRIEPSTRDQALRRIAEDLTQRAWTALEPYLLEASGRTIARTTATTPVLGDD